MIEAAIEELQERGVAGMSFSEVLARSGAARGAIYHHFPGGKAELVREATRVFGERVVAAIGTLPTDSPRATVTAFLDTVRPVVRDAGDGRSCAVAAAAAGASGLDPELLEVADAAFTNWIGALATRLETAGLTRRDAKALAATLINALEGAQVLTRAGAGPSHFRTVAQWILDHLDA